MTNLFFIQCENEQTACAYTCCHLHLSIACVIIAISLLVVFSIIYFVYRCNRDKRELNYLERMHSCHDLVIINNLNHEYKMRLLVSRMRIRR